MKFREISWQEALAVPGLVWNEKADTYMVEHSRHVWEVTKDGTVIFIVGIYFHTAMSITPFVWLVPTTALRPIHWRGLRKGFGLLQMRNQAIAAIIDLEHEAALRMARRLGFVQVDEGTFLWH